MPSDGNVLGILNPRGGGDPIPLHKPEILVGRRPSCDICLDFHNISGKHCKLSFLNSVWHIRDLGSTNGTTLNGARLVSEHSLMPDDELGIAGHLFTLEYDPGGPESVLEQHRVMDEEVVEARKRHSLMELAGLDTDEDKPRQRRPTRAPATIERLSADEAEFDDTLPEHIKKEAPKSAKVNDDDFLKLIEDDVKDGKL